jgi:hypothetical protein
MGCVLLAALASTTPAHALPMPAVPLAANAANATVQVVIDGHTVGTFTELVSVSASHEPSAKSARKFTVVLRRTASSNIEMAAWHEMAMLDPAAAKKAVSVTVFAGSTPTMRFSLTKAFPTKVEYTAVPKSTAVMETVTLTCEFLARVGV